ncbi:mannitol-1-phosphate 5-dehydrogenase [Neobacillus sp. MM2021_6]|uniref:mannitol-1-phosphate 5-dehydrogenase n=1 Tax=Bacillaceae TaxID=186817 RepID=UPI0014086294|nr:MULTISPECIES: mannitol-1-phosphate 5-dehydrogenase [Bacillaceae]MBO0960528.1 mannitol-1-phosphate 5-dehydrogenase [Neobacillus sp. MM2021_6]NHC21108.1 mannitol-1-phosphate 5-dehydrogenase [Bacillus sp. MM2020_4]
MLAVHFGAGNIGRGFIGNLLYHSDYETCFVDVNDEIVRLLNEKKEYRVVLAEPAQQEDTIKNVRAINSAANPEQVIAAIAEADLVTTAIGPNILPLIAGLIADGLRKRIEQTDRPLTIIACENMIGGSSLLKEKIFEKLTADEKAQFEGRFGFPDSAVDRIVPNQVNEDKIMVKVEPFYEWVVEEPKIIGEKPPVKGITYVQELVPYIERKLFTVNTGHALAAYFGYYFGMETINQAMENQEIRGLVEGSLKESGEFLVGKYGFNEEEHDKYIQKIIGRFSNAYIIDEVTRVGRSPIRKLGPNDRLVSPARQYVEVTGKQPEHLLKGIAAALLYDFQGDEEAVHVQTVIKEQGVEAAIQKYTQLEPGSRLFQGIIEQYKQLEKK